MKRAKIALVVMCCWLTFPFLALWIWITNPGKCALIWKKEMCETWWEEDAN